MKTLDEVRTVWQQQNTADLKQLQPAAAQAPQLQGLRSVAWKECLLFETSDVARWPHRLAESRSAYNALRQHFLRALHHPDELESAIDPLAEDNESPWEALRRDEAIRAEIFQDVERCMPDNLYFRQPATQNMLLDVLFIFSKLNPDVGYRQGMHELLAPVVWVVERDALDTRRWKRSDIEDTKDDKLLSDLLDQRYIEHDAFTLFCLIMQSAKTFYEPGSGTAPKTASSVQATVNGEAPILAKINRIYSKLVPKYDPELSAHLVKLDVLPQVFLMRWIRLLFGREFPFDDVLGIWDQVFASDPSLGLVDYICIAMILRIRWQLLEADANDALTLLLKYPDDLGSSAASDLALDALALRQDQTPAAGAKIISKRTGRTLIAPSANLERPTTPTGEFPPTMGSPNRPPSPVRSPSRFATPIPVLGLEGLLTDAARAAYSRGERWGLSRAVRDAVGDVRKNFAAFNPSPRGSLHQRASSTDIVRKISQLEARNKALGTMLEAALAELWECQRREVEKHDDETTEADKSAADALGVAIAKVQFVQVYLGDQSLPLPVDEIAPEHNNAEVDRGSPRPRQHVVQAEESESVESALADALGPSKQSADELKAATRDSPAAKSAAAPHDGATPPEEQTSTPDVRVASLQSTDSGHLQPTMPASLAPDASSNSSPRPSLEQSSFSWMLGHQSADRQHAFASASPFTDEAALPSRSRAMGKGFLFGEEDAEDAAGTEEKGRRGSQEEAKKGRRRSNLLRKKPPSSARSGKDHGAAERRNSAAAEQAREDINLDAL